MICSSISAYGNAACYAKIYSCNSSLIFTSCLPFLLLSLSLTCFSYPLPTLPSVHYSHIFSFLPIICSFNLLSCDTYFPLPPIPPFLLNHFFRATLLQTYPVRPTYPRFSIYSSSVTYFALLISSSLKSFLSSFLSHLVSSSLTFLSHDLLP